MSVIGVALLPIIWWAGLLCLALGIFVIWAWYTESQKTKKYKYLRQYRTEKMRNKGKCGKI